MTTDKSRADALTFEITEQMAAEWADRNELENVLTSFSTQRNAIEDARTLHLLAASPVEQPAAAPIPMLLFCPRCGTQHVDRPEVHSEADASIGLQIKEVVTWDNPPHRSHLCHACGVVWRPADVATVGVQSIETHGKADTWTADMPWIGHNRTAPAPVDRRHVGDSKFEGWYSSYAVKRESNPKQIARDAYAAGMGDMTPQPAPSPADERAAEPWPQKNEYSEAWLAICNTLEEVAPEWHHGEECGMDKACRAIRAMAAKIKDLSSDVHHIYGAYGDACARAASASETGAEGAVAWFDKELNNVRWKEGLVNADFRDGQPFYTQPPAQAAEPAAWQYRPIINGKPYPWIECTKEAAKRLRADDYRETHEVRALYAAPQPAQADARQTDDEWWNQALRERDIYEEYADEMASAIANHLHIEIGEHSNFNNPWLKALEAIKNARQAAARVGLTADMRVAIQECIDYLKPAAKDFADLNMGDSKHARCIRTLRALLAAHPGQPEPRAEVTHGDTTMGECMASLLDRLEVAELYADRYRYLRERPLNAVSVGGVFAGKTPDNVVLNGADLDAAIDAARTGASS